MEVHIYQTAEGFSPFRIGTCICVDPLHMVQVVSDYTIAGYTIVVCQSYKTGTGSMIDSRYNQLSGWNFTSDR